MDLLTIESPAFLKVLNTKELENLAQNVRDFLIESLTKTGGPLSSNLSAVELSIGLHRVFNSPTDKIIFDGNDQTLTHKILTGRAKHFSRFGQQGGLSSFQSKNESAHDPYDGSSFYQGLSIGYGLSMKNDADHIVVVLNNQSIQSGYVFEALNHISMSKKKMIVVINDYQSSDQLKSVSTSLKKLMVAKPISQFKDDMSQYFDKGNVITGPIKRGLKSITTNLSKTVATTNLFTELGFKYVGPFDAHSIRDVLRVLNFAKDSQESVVVHFKSQKGKGYQIAHNDKDGLWVKLNKFDLKTGTQIVDYPINQDDVENILIDYILEYYQKNSQLVIVNTIDKLGSKLEGERIHNIFSDSHHPISFSSGLSLAGYNVLLLVDSKVFTSRVTPLINELSQMNLDITIVDFNSGLNSLDGGLQSSLFEYPMTSIIPNIIIAQGKNSDEMIQLLELSFSYKGPFVLRIQNEISYQIKYPLETNFSIGQWELIKGNVEQPKAVLFVFGSLVENITQKINSNQLPYWVVNARFINLMDESLMNYLKQYETKFFVISQEYGFGALSQLLIQFLVNNKFHHEFHNLGLNKELFEYGSSSVLKKNQLLDTQSILTKVGEFLD